MKFCSISGQMGIVSSCHMVNSSLANLIKVAVTSDNGCYTYGYITIKQ